MKENLVIRPAVSEDSFAVHGLLRIIADLHRNGRPDMFPNLTSKYSLDEVEKRLSEPENGIFVADLGGQVVGYVFCDIIKEGNGDTLYIDDLCVDPSSRRGGIGTALLDHAAKYGKEKNCRFVMLNVWEFNKNALEFYQKYGFATRTRHLELPL